MRKVYVFVGIFLALSLVFSGMAISEDVISIKGKVKTIDLKTNTAVVTTRDSQDVTVTVEDETTLAKFKDGRISEGDEVKVKYVIKNGKNISTYFKKAAGC